MTVPTQTEVLVVGAGPVGLATAISLIAAGHDVTLIDGQGEGANTSRAAVVHPRTLEALEEIGVSKPMVALGLHTTRFTIRDRDRLLVPIRFDQLKSAYDFILMIPQNVTEQVLLERFTELGGVVHRPYAAKSLHQDGEGVTVSLADGSEIRARYVVGADGMHSVIRDEAGLGFHGETLPLSLVLADIRVDGGLSRDEVVLHFSRTGMLVVAPLPNGTFRLVAEIDPAPEHPDVAFAQELLDTRGPGGSRAKVQEVVWGSRFRIHERVVPSYRAGRVLLAGDAAHTHSPAGGQGMNLGLRDAVALGNALSLALRENRTEALDEYAEASRAEALQVVALAHRLTKLATAPAAVRPIRNLVLRTLAMLPAFRRTLAEQLSRIGRR